jgi:Preprotein translocase subunit SecB
MESKFQFKSPYLVQMDYKTNEDFERAEETFDIAIPCKLNNEVAMSEDGLAAKVTLTISVGSDECPFVANVSMESEFEWEPDTFSEETVKDLLQNNASALLLSYARPIIANITNASKYPAFNIPFIDLTKN